MRFLKTIFRPFFFKSQKTAQTARPVQPVSNTQPFDISKFKNVDVQKITKPARKSIMLPPKSQNKKNGLSICFQLNDLLFYVFYMQEKDGFLRAPMRRQDHTYYSQHYELDFLFYFQKSMPILLSNLALEHQLIVYTTAEQKYTQEVLQQSKYRMYFDHVLNQDHCQRLVDEQEDIDQYIKDVNLINRDIKRTFLVECDGMKMFASADNVLVMERYRGQQKDINPLYYLQMVNAMKSQEDIRVFLNKCFRVKDKMKDARIFSAGSQ